MQLNHALGHFLRAADAVIQVMEILDQEECVRLSKFVLPPGDWLRYHPGNQTVDEAQGSVFTQTKLSPSFITCQLRLNQTVSVKIIYQPVISQWGDRKPPYLQKVLFQFPTGKLDMHTTSQCILGYTMMVSFQDF